MYIIEPARSAIDLSISNIIVFILLNRFVKPIMSNDSTPQDRALNMAQFIIYGYRSADNPGSGLNSFTVHGVGADLPTSDGMMYNPAVDSNQPFANVAVPVCP